MYKKTLNFSSKANYRIMSSLLVDAVFTSESRSEIKIDFCKKANKVTITGESANDVYKFWRSTGRTPLEFHLYSA